MPGPAARALLDPVPQGGVRHAPRRLHKRYGRANARPAGHLPHPRRTRAAPAATRERARGVLRALTPAHSRAAAARCAADTSCSAALRHISANIGTDDGDLPASVKSGLQAWYKIENYGHNSWLDDSGNGRTAKVTGPSTRVTEAGNGAAAEVEYLRGTKETTIVFPSALTPSFTMCSVTRYASADAAAQARILQAGSFNFLHGHWARSVGVAFYTSWLRQQSVVSGTRARTDWLVMCGSNTGRLVLVGDALHDTAAGRSQDDDVWINAGHAKQEKSEFGIVELLTWSRALSRAEMALVGVYLRLRLAHGTHQRTSTFTSTSTTTTSSTTTSTQTTSSTSSTTSTSFVCPPGQHKAPFEQPADAVKYHIAPRGASACPLGTAAVAQAECGQAGLEAMAEKGESASRQPVAGNGTGAPSSSWGGVPPGCSVQSGGDWATHYNTGNGTNNGGYSPVCRIIASARCVRTTTTTTATTATTTTTTATTTTATTGTLGECHGGPAAPQKPGATVPGGAAFLPPSLPPFLPPLPHSCPLPLAPAGAGLRWLTI